MAKNLNVLVTGSTGYIAKHIILQLLEVGYNVRGSVRDLSRGDAVKATIAGHLDAEFDIDEKLNFVALDLQKDAGWDAAMRGIDILVHTASPVVITQPKNHDDIVKPAVEGTLRALKAAHVAGVKRVVMTSSIASIMHHNEIGDRSMLDERDWNDLNPKHVTAYSKSKTLAERAAWNFVNGDGVNIDLTAINPGVALGAPLDHVIGASVSIVERILTRKDPAVPNIGFVCVDVRDVAKMHVNAIDREASFGKRYIAADCFVWFAEFAEVLAVKFPQYNVITRRAPNWLIRIMAMFDGDLKSVSQDLGVKREASNLAATTDLDIEFRDVKTSTIETAQYFIDNEMV